MKRLLLLMLVILLGIAVLWPLGGFADDCPGYAPPNEWGVRAGGLRVPRELWPPGSPIEESVKWADWIDEGYPICLSITYHLPGQWIHWPGDDAAYMEVHLDPEVGCPTGLAGRKWEVTNGLLSCPDCDFDCDGTADGEDPDTEDTYIPPQRLELNQGWGDDPSLYCPTKAGGASVNVATGNHTERVVDLSVSVPGLPLEFVRFYNSQSTRDSSLGFGWTHSYNLSVSDLGDEVLVWAEDGRALSFVREGEGLQARFGVKDLLEEDPAGGFVYTRGKTQWRYLFDQDGRLMRIEDLSGNSLDLVYGTDELRVESSFGKSLILEYTDGRIDKLIDPKGNQIAYGYEEGNLSSVLYPDGQETTYLYEDPEDPHNMTAELDREGEVVGLWGYDSRDRTILSEGAEGADHMELEYEFFKTLITDGRGHTKTFHTLIQEHIYLVAEISGEGCESCRSNQRSRYDHTLNLIEKTDGLGTRAVYENYDAHGNPWTITEAVETPEERIIGYSYTYDESNPLLVREKVETRKSLLSPEGEKITTWTYDEAGNLISKEDKGYVLIDEVPTLRTQKTEYHYTGLGQLEWIDGPRTDVTDRTDFEYYENDPSQGDNRGQLKAIVNALGRRTEFSDYDANGNVGKITDPNGVVTIHTYDERNRVQTITNEETGGLTEYVYDSHGNTDYVILPEGNTIDYDHDLADRLTEIKDDLGNRIVYTPDTEGNIETEEIFDHGGGWSRPCPWNTIPTTALNGSSTRMAFFATMAMMETVTSPP
jgi:YD repeat-containing protein